MKTTENPQDTVEYLKAKYHLNLFSIELTPLPPEQTHLRTDIVVFGGTEIQVQFVNGEPYIALKPIVESLGLNWSGQFSRVKRDLVLQKAICTAQMANSQHNQEMTMLKLKYVPGWLFTIDNTAVSENVRNKLIEY